MNNFLMSIRFNKQSPQDFGLTCKNGRFILDKDGSEWLPYQLYDLGWGQENGFVRLPLCSFEKLIQLVLSDDDLEDSYGAAAMILDRFTVELKQYLINNMQRKIRFSDRKKLRKLNQIFHLHRGINLSYKEGMSSAEMKAEDKDWKQIASYFSAV